MLANKKKTREKHFNSLIHFVGVAIISVMGLKQLLKFVRYSAKIKFKFYIQQPSLSL